MIEKTQAIKTENLKKKTNIFPILAMIIGSCIILSVLFLPFATAKGEYKQYLMEHPSEMYIEEIQMTCKDAVDISLIEFWKIYSEGENVGYSEIGISYMVVVSIFAVTGAITLLCSILKKPRATMIGSIVTFIIFQIIKWDFKARGVIPNNNYNWGIAQYICYLGVIIAIVGAVTLLREKIKEKKQRK